jgi:hypothetical protein
MADGITLEGGTASLLTDAAAGTSAPSGLSAFAGRPAGDAAWGFSSGTLAAASTSMARSLSGALVTLLERIDAADWPGADASSGMGLARDPDAPTTLAPGVYTLPGSGAQIRIASGDTWGQVAARMAGAFGSGGLGDLSRLVPVTGGALSESGMERLARSLTDVLAAHNEAADMLARSAARLDPGAAEAFAAPAQEHAGALADLGVERTGNRLWLFGEAFLSAVAEDPEGARTTLFGEQGFLPALRGAAETALAAAGRRNGAAAQETSDPVARLFGAGSSGPSASATGQGGLVDVYDAQGGAAAEGSALLSAARLVRSLG